MVYSTNQDYELFKHAAIGIVIDSYFKGGQTKIDLGMYNRLLKNDVPATLELILDGKLKYAEREE